MKERISLQGEAREHRGSRWGITILDGFMNIFMMKSYCRRVMVAEEAANEVACGCKYPLLMTRVSQQIIPLV